MLASALLVLTGIWHSLAVYHFAVHPERTIARYTEARPVSEVAAALLRFLGGLNAAIVALAAVAFLLDRSAWWAVFLVLGIANASQAVFDVWAHRRGLTRGTFHRDITLGDVLFTVGNLAACAAEIALRGGPAAL